MSLRKLFINIYGTKVVDNILEPDILHIKKNKDKLNHFIKNEYKRIKLIKDNNFIIEGCVNCISKGIVVRIQDFPGWTGELKNKDLIIVGLEGSLKIKTDIHICYNLGNKRDKIDELLYDRFKNIFNNFEERAYITDLAKCISSNVNKSRRICMDYFIKEIVLLRNLNMKNNLKVIFQGYKVQEYFERRNLLKIDKTFEFYPLIRCGRLKFEKIKPFQTIVFPHTANYPTTREYWDEIKEKSNEIKEVLGEIKR